MLEERQNNNIFKVKDLFPKFFNSKDKFPSMLGLTKNYKDKFNNFKLGSDSSDKYYIVGRPGDERLRLNKSGFAVVTNITDKEILNPVRSAKDDSQVFAPSQVKEFKNQVGLDFPSISGMSGGIILKTILIIEEGQVVKRICRPVGTVWGSERIFIENDHADNQPLIVDLKSMMNKII